MISRGIAHFALVFDVAYSNKMILNLIVSVFNVLYGVCYLLIGLLDHVITLLNCGRGCGDMELYLFVSVMSRMLIYSWLVYATYMPCSNM